MTHRDPLSTVVVLDDASVRIANHCVSFGAGWRLDLLALTLRMDGRAVGLTRREFELLRFLATHPNQVFSRDDLLASVWGSGYSGFPHTVSSHVQRLRAKIESNPQRPCLIATVWASATDSKRPAA